MTGPGPARQPVGDADRDSAYVDASGGDSLSRRECLDYLAMADLGHLALSQGALPVVVPVNLALVGEEVIVRTQPGSKLVAAALHAVVAVQAEGVAPDRRHAWSVLVQGVAREVTHPDQLAWLRREGPRPLVPHRGGHFIAIPTQLISGRRFPLRPEDDGRFHEL